MKIKTAKTIALLSLKVFSCFCIAYVTAFIGQELIAYESFSFLFIFLSIGSGFFYFMKPYKLKGVLIINLCLIATALLMRFYITVAYTPL